MNADAIKREDLQHIVKAALPWHQLQNKSVLITGARGFLPSYMVETLLLLNDLEGLQCRVAGLVRNLETGWQRFSEYQNREDFSLILGDVSEDIEWPDRFDIIIHAASQASPRYYGTDPVGTMNANILGTSHLLRRAKEWNSTEFLYFSSSEVYGAVPAEKIPTAEQDYGYIDITNSRSCYAESKRAAETLGMCFAHQYKTPFKVVRPFHTYGPGVSLNDGRVFADFVSDVVNGKNITLRSDGSAVRSFCYVSDAVRGFFTVLLCGAQTSSYNVGNPAGAVSIRNLAELLVGLFPEKKLSVHFDVGNHKEGYVPSKVSINQPNVSKMNELGWSPELTLEEGFRRMVLSYS